MKEASMTNSAVYPVLLAGGTGTRLWPVSREFFPKQLANLVGADSLVQGTIKRLRPVLDLDKIIVVCGQEHYFEIKRHLEAIGVSAEDKIISEPAGRNTAPAILLAALHILKSDKDAVLLVLPADHVISDVAGFHEKIKTAVRLAEDGYIATFGIKPDYPETGYGYIEGAKNIGEEALSIKRFVEKPDEKTAQKYVEAGNYFWNSGMFAFKASVIVEEYKNLQPDLYAKMEEFLAEPSRPRQAYEQLADISIDYAIMEKTEKGAVLPSSFGWSDIGSWKSLYDYLPKDKDNNVIEGDVIAKETKNSFIKGGGRLIVANGLENIVVVETPDTVFISDLDKSQGVKAIVQDLKSKKRKEYQAHATVYRPWGYYTTLEEMKNTKLKRIVVYPGAKLSLQMHYHRSEHWIVAQGAAKIFNGDKTVFLKENESTYIPKNTVHRLENSGKIPLHIIEAQMGDYLEEDDIVRFDDDFGRPLDKKLNL
ncbi:MAG: mannose-1-phosphate guanylyltransferase/mannose-6-phosphate isomerase [bacterium]